MPTEKKLDYSEPRLLSGEDPKEFDALAASIRKRFEIFGDDHSYLIADLANCEWHRRRLEKIKAYFVASHLSGETTAEDYKRVLKAVQRSMRIVNQSCRWTLDMLLYFKGREEARLYAESQGKSVTEAPLPELRGVGYSLVSSPARVGSPAAGLSSLAPRPRISRKPR